MTKVVVNLTPHTITVMNDEGNIIKEFPSEGLARLSVKTVRGKSIVIDGVEIPTSYSEFGEVEGLPKPTYGVYYIVSSLIAGRYPLRADLLIPNESIRDEKGRIIGCKSLGRI